MEEDDNILEFSNLFNQNYEALEDYTCQFLKDRYNHNFIVSGVNISYGNFSIILTLYPEDEPTLLFTAWIDKNNIVHDNYLEKRCLQEIEKQIQSVVPNGLAKACFLVKDSVEETDTEIMLMSYLKKHQIHQLLIRMIYIEKALPDKDMFATLLENLIALYHVDMVMRCWAFGDEGFEKCSEILSKVPAVNETIIDRYAPISLISFMTKDGTVKQTEAKRYGIH